MSLDLEDQYDKIYRYCYFKTRNQQLAEDLTQETFLKYFSQTSYINRGKPLAYLYTIARNLCIDANKKIKVESLQQDIPVGSEFDRFATNFEVKQAVESLSKDLQELVLLRYVNDLSLAEVSSIAGCSRFVIYRKLQKALKNLKQMLREDDFFE
ncbi:RNA polymerase sigma factor [Bacillus sp. HMF5848]|uniref:RNA polymerase sigma factor n=1 Tax=Bacillus sp. HMF5848 TaxID=2495421 RepID=UPI000F77E4A6|nr:RNA polymerase sigma factor [Bacillus sp. HMF5848]RSK26255.1 RNA polymerase sigma factor [Bacillus sp. HMF5848]